MVEDEDVVVELLVVEEEDVVGELLDVVEEDVVLDDEVVVELVVFHRVGLVKMQRPSKR